MRREPIEVRKATLASILRKSRSGVRLNEHLEHPLERDNMSPKIGERRWNESAGSAI
jgi:hypothetical protein